MASWLLGFSVSGLLGHLISCSFLVLYGLLASWFPWRFGLSACWLSTSFSFVYYIILCHIELYEKTYICILLKCIMF